jgi:hypothetical protein
MPESSSGAEPPVRLDGHVVGARVWLWELLPDPSYSASPVYAIEEGQRQH